jgi:serine/threonine-protein kinase
MNDPAKDPEPEAPQPPTTDYRAGAATGATVLRANLVLRPGPAAHTAGEIRDVLRTRLRFIVLIVLVLNLGSLPVFLPGILAARRWDVVAFLAGEDGILLVFAALLWSSRPIGLGWLRTQEIALFGVLLFSYAGFLTSSIGLGALKEFAPLKEYGVVALSGFCTLPAFALMVLYGTIIPNTGRRCAIVVGAMALFPPGMTAIYLAARQPPLHRDLLVSFLFYMVSMLGYGAAIAVYGSHRIDVLRREAIAARRLGQYQLHKLLGGGGMGQVYLAEHVLLRRPCALKVIRPDRAADRISLLRFEREVQATATLTHPNTVEIYDYGHAADGTFYYVMEYLPGLNLERVIELHGPLDSGRALHLLRQVCGALQEAHGIGLIHRDIKPSNIIVCERGGVPDVSKLVDFGLVQLNVAQQDDNRLTQENMAAGTPAYMSPEQAAAGDNVDARSDIYSLGAVAYFVLTGQPPFVRSNAMRILAAHISEAPVPLSSLRSDVPADVQAVVLRCLEKDPGNRFQDCESLERALAACACAGTWTRQDAVAWWQTRDPAGSPVRGLVESR